MVTTLLKLRLRLLHNTLTREVWRAIVAALGILYALGMITALAGAAFFLGLSGADLAAPALAAGTILTLLWVLVPLLAFGVDDTLDPQRFALFTTPTLRFGAGLILAGGVSIPGFLTLGGLLAMTLAWTGQPRVIPAWLIAAVVGFATCATLARVCTTAASTHLRSRRGRDVLAVIGVFAIFAVALAPTALGELDLTSMWAALQPALAVIAWTPLGAPWAIPGAIAAGKLGAATAYLLTALAWLGLLLWLWVRLLDSAMTRPAEASVSVRKGAGRFDLPQRLEQLLRLPGVSAAVAARALRYWRSDPRYLTQAVTIVVIGPLVAIALLVTPDAPGVLLVGMPVMTGLFAGWSIHNDTAYDSTAIWLHISSGARGRDDRLGRAAALLLWGVPVLAAMTLGTLAYTSQWGIAAPVTGVVLAIFGGGLGISLAISGLMVYPVQPPGTSPFSTTGMGAIGLTLLIQSLTMIGTLALAIPTIATAILAFVVAPVWGYVSLAAGLLTAAAGVVLGVSLGGKFLDQRAPGHLLSMRGWSGH